MFKQKMIKQVSGLHAQADIESFTLDQAEAEPGLLLCKTKIGLCYLDLSIKIKLGTPLNVN